MPELPEVETVTRRLTPLLSGRSIREVMVRWPRSISTPSVRSLQSTLPGKRFSQISRRGKYIICHLEPSGYLIVHLRMSGDLIFVPTRSPLGKHEHVVLRLSGGKDLRFDDTRKFGRMYFVEDPSEVTGKLGPEPLDDAFTADIFGGMLAKRNATVKTLLLNQTFLAGLGNIYVVESLWHAGVHPLRKSSSIKPAETKKLYQAIRSVIRRAIEHQGTDLGDGVWKSGVYTPRVYGREGEKCSRCKTSIERMVLGQRGTEYCPRCQK